MCKGASPVAQVLIKPWVSLPKENDRLSLYSQSRKYSGSTERGIGRIGVSTHECNQAYCLHFSLLEALLWAFLCFQFVHTIDFFLGYSHRSENWSGVQMYIKFWLYVCGQTAFVRLVSKQNHCPGMIFFTHVCEIFWGRGEEKGGYSLSQKQQKSTSTWLRGTKRFNTDGFWL